MCAKWRNSTYNFKIVSQNEWTLYGFVQNLHIPFICEKSLYSLLLYEIIVLFTVVCIINVLRRLCAKSMCFEGCLQNQWALNGVCKFNGLRRLCAKSMCFEGCLQNRCASKVVCKINGLWMLCVNSMYFEGCLQNRCASKVVCKFNVLRRLFAKSMCFKGCVQINVLRRLCT